MSQDNKTFQWTEDLIEEMLVLCGKNARFSKEQLIGWKDQFKKSKLPAEEQPKVEPIKIKKVVSAHTTDYDGLEPLIYIYPSRHLEPDETKGLRKAIETFLNSPVVEQEWEKEKLNDKFPEGYVSKKAYEKEWREKQKVLGWLSIQQQEHSAELEEAFNAARETGVELLDRGNTPLKHNDFKSYCEWKAKQSTPPQDKAEKEITPLFYDENKNPIYEGDRSWYVNSRFIIDFYDFYDHGNGADDLRPFPENFKYFSTKEAAEKWIEWNEPKYSFAAIMAKSRLLYGKEGFFEERSFFVEDFTEKSK